MSGPVARLLPDGRRLHLQHGPIDLIVEAFGVRAEIESAHRQAWGRFQTVLSELVEELAWLRQPVSEGFPELRGPVARRMVAACRPHRANFITPMAAVAGAVADAVLAAMLVGRRLDRAYINNGGDIALYLSPGTRFEVGLVANVDHPSLDAVAAIDAGSPVRGVATSGWRGRSFSLGIADSATVLAADAAAADAAVTLVANAVNLDHPAIARVRACDLDPSSDLGERPVVTGVGALSGAEVDEALERGATVAETMRARGTIFGAALVLQGRMRLVGAPMTGIAAAA